MRRSGAATASALLLAALAGCGSGSSSDGQPTASSSPTASTPSYDPEKQRIADATANLTDFFAVYSPLGERTYFTRTEAGCIAGRVVREPGIERLQKAGVLNDELQYVIDADPSFARRDARSITAAVFDCSKAEQVLRRQAIRDLDDATPAQRACAARKLTDDLLAVLFTLALQDKPLHPGGQKVAEAFAHCRDV